MEPMDGHVLPGESSSNDESLGLDKPDEIRSVLQANGAVYSNKTDSDGVPYLIRASYVNGDEAPGRKFYVAIGTSLAGNRQVLKSFTLRVVALVPVVILTGCIMGWCRRRWSTRHLSGWRRWLISKKMPATRTISRWPVTLKRRWLSRRRRRLFLRDARSLAGIRNRCCISSG